MRRQGSVWLVATVLALGAAACFSDPTKALRSGPTRLQLSQYTVTLKAGDSLGVRAYVLDDQGNQLDVGTPTWTSADPTVATVRADAAAPGNVFANGVVVGVNNQAGVTDVTVSLQGVSATVRVTVLPATFPGAISVSGTAGADTVTINRPAPLPPLVVTYSAGDTLVLNSTSTVTFSATSSTVSFGPNSAYIVARSATQIKAMARTAFAGKPTVTNLTYAGSAATGPIAIASISTDSIQIQHARFRGTIALAASAFGANTQVTVTAPTGLTFSSSSKLVLGSTNAIVLSASGATLTAISSAAFNGVWKVTGVTVGAATVDSLRPADSTHVVVSASFFPGTVTNGTGNLLDTVVIRGNGNATFKSTSVATIGGKPALRILFTADSLKVISVVGSSIAASISNVVVAGTTISSLTTQAAVNVSTATTGEANEPGNNAQAGATATAFAGAADTITTYGSVDCEDDGTACPGNGDGQDYYLLTTTASTNLRAILTWYGTGVGGSPYGSDPGNPDLDLIMCTNNGNLCYYGTANRIGSSTGQIMPETASTTAAKPAGTYYVYVAGFVTPSPISYRLQLLRF